MNDPIVTITAEDAATAPLTEGLRTKLREIYPNHAIYFVAMPVEGGSVEGGLFIPDGYDIDETCIEIITHLGGAAEKLEAHRASEAKED